MPYRHQISTVFCCLVAAAVAPFGLCETFAPTTAESTEIKFAVIGDFGGDNPSQAAVAEMIKTNLKPDFIITVGDNNYLELNSASYDAAVGKYYSEYIGAYAGIHGSGSPTNRFWPALGNHDWAEKVEYRAYLEYFTLPGNERYYDFAQGPVHFFVVNSDVHEPDGRSRTSKQAQWLKAALAASKSKWKFVVFHHPPFSSADVHNSNPHLQWPFKQWGAHAVLTGHDHTYERLDIGGIPYFVNGFGGKSLYKLAAPLPQTKFRFNATYGAMCITVNEQRAIYETYTTDNGGTLIDSFTLVPDAIVADLVPPSADWKYLDDGSDQGNAWRASAFEDSSWKTGAAQLGFGDGDETTSIDSGPNPHARHITTYFRHRFHAAGIANIQQLRLAMLVDDGAVAYINGHEIARFNMPDGPVNHVTLASTAVNDRAENVFHEFTVDAKLLSEGENVIAVEIHQADAARSDLGFDLMLTPIMRN